LIDARYRNCADEWKNWQAAKMKFLKILRDDFPLFFRRARLNLRGRKWD